MMRCAFTIPGKPLAQERRGTRIVHAGHRVFAKSYDPAQSKNAKATVQQLARDGWNGCVWVGPVRVAITCWFELPRASWRKRNPTPEGPYAGKPDADNLAKLICDAMQGVVYLNDSQISELHVVKRRAAQGEPAKTVVVAESIDDGGADR